MARRQRTTPFEDLISIVARLPWWVCLLLAAVSYVVFAALAAPSAAPLVTQPGQIAAVAAQAMWKAFAFAGQIVVPIACLAGAVISAFRQHRRGVLVSSVAKSPAAGALNGISWREFEVLVGEGFRLQGYQVLETGGGGPDGGIDLVLKREGERFLVQCKQWRALKVGVSVVRELYGVMAARGAAGGFVVTSGSFTAEAEAFASGRNVTLVDGKKLFGLIQQAKTAKAAKPTRASSAAGTAQAKQERTTPFRVPVGGDTVGRVPASAVPSCPLCDNPMVLRTAKKGAYAGSSFWGCSRYPGCKGTRPGA